MDYIEFSGNHEQLGRRIGSKFRSVIHKRLEYYKSKVDFKSALTGVFPYIKETSSRFPELIVETKAIAEGAHIPFNEYFLLNTPELLEQNTLDHCTTVFTHFDGNPVVGHNEDSGENGEVLDDFYVLKATIGETTFLGVQYKFELPGTAINLNNHGIVFGLNSLHPFTRVGVPKNFVARSMLECTSLAEAEHILSTTQHASGFNHFLVFGDTVLDIAIAKSVQETKLQKGGCYVHTNHYLSEEGTKLEKRRNKNSELRYETAMERIEENMNPTELLHLLDSVKPTNFLPYDGETFLTAFVYVNEGILEIIDKNQLRFTYSL